MMTQQTTATENISISFISKHPIMPDKKFFYCPLVVSFDLRQGLVMQPTPALNL
jgi:hypothetical protein